VAVSTPSAVDGRVFRSLGAVEGGQVTADTEFRYRELDGMVWASYDGGAIRHAHLVGTRADDRLDFRYVQLLRDGTTATGRCTSTIETLPDGRLRLHEQWAWESQSGEGTSVVEEDEPLAHPSGVSLRPIVGREEMRAILRLKVAPGQDQFVAPNPVSLAQGQAHEPPGWMRGIWDGDRAVGFVMMADERAQDGRWFLWRFMIAEGEQGKGYGRAALELVCRHARRGADTPELYVSWVEGEGGPAPFYRKFGFEPTGEVQDDEIIARLTRWPE
jgi:Acetyltransferase (GNAT) family